MPAKKPYPAPPKVTRGRRTSAEKEARRWRLSIKEATETKDGYSWTTYIVQGWQEGSRWQRKRFKSRAEAEAFKASKELELLPTEDVQRIVITGLSQAQAREAEGAFALLAGVGSLTGTDGQPITLSLRSAVVEYIENRRAAHAVELVPFRKAMDACIADKLARKKLRPRSAVQLKSSLSLFLSWLTRLDRYTAESLDPSWSPPVSDVTAEDLVQYLGSLRGKTGMTAAPKSWNNTRGDIGGFYQWCMGREGKTPIPGCKRRWALFNPAHHVPTVHDVDHSPAILAAADAAALMARLEREWPEYVPFLALALFAGIRPGENGELFKLARHEHIKAPSPLANGRPLMDMERGNISLLAPLTKTGKKRTITIRPNLAAWLAAYPGPILPVGFHRGLEKIRKQCGLTHDILRHTFISHLVPLIGKALTAVQAGNSEKMIDDHYLSHPSEAEAAAFWQIMPSGKA